MTTKAMTRNPATETAVARAMAYGLLARCFAYPDASTLAAMRDAESAAAGALADTPVAALAEAVRAIPDGHGLREEHGHLFSATFSPDCPNFETAYLCPGGDNQTARMADIAGFYHAFGVDSGASGHRPDDISVELEFMGFLCRKQAYAEENLGPERVAEGAEAQRMFLREHLGRWAPSLGARLGVRAEPGSFYACLGEALVAWLAADCARLGTGPIEAAGPPTVHWPTPEEEDAANPSPAPDEDGGIQWD